MPHMSHSPVQGPSLAMVPGENPSLLCQVTCGWHCHTQGSIEPKGNTNTAMPGKLLITHSVFN